PHGRGAIVTVEAVDMQWSLAPAPSASSPGTIDIEPLRSDSLARIEYATIAGRGDVISGVIWDDRVTSPRQLHPLGVLPNLRRRHHEIGLIPAGHRQHASIGKHGDGGIPPAMVHVGALPEESA